MSKYSSLHDEYLDNLLKAIAHLEYSYNKVINLPRDPEKLNEESLETWESFSARFARCIDLFTSKYIQVSVKINDPGFEGSLRDFVNQAEKLGLVDSADEWMEARGLRNITAHEYKSTMLKKYFEDILSFAPKILKLKDKLKK